MLTCAEVSPQLPGLATGEPSDPLVREHVARCDACRAARDELAQRVEHLRRDLTSLAPSPWLEDAVVDDLAITRQRTLTTTRRRMAYVAAAALAAAALFLAVWLPRSRPMDAQRITSEDGDGERLSSAHIELRPSAGEVEAARRNALRTHHEPATHLGEHKLVFVSVLEDERLLVQDGTELRSPPAGAVYRHLYAGQGDLAWGVRIFESDGRPLAGDAVTLGAGFLDRLRTMHGATTIIAEDVLVIRQGDLWRTMQGSMEGELTIAAPLAGGATASVRVVVRPDYTGTLAIPESFARALGLHLWEVPGELGFREHGVPDRTFGEGVARALARVVIDSVGVDDTLEVQVIGGALPWGTERRPSHEERAVRLDALPHFAVCGEDVRVDASQGTWEWDGARVLRLRTEEEPRTHEWSFDPGDGAWRFHFMFQPPTGRLPSLPDEPVLGPLFRAGGSSVLPQALDLSAGIVHRLDTRHVRLEGAWPVGAGVTIARVWQGPTAIPSAEGVVCTQVAEDGTIAFTRIVGERGATLRMLLTTREGESTFHDIVVAPALVPPRVVTMHLHEQGRVRLDESPLGSGWNSSLFDGAWQGDAKTGRPPEERLEDLAEALGALAGGSGARQKHGATLPELTLSVDPHAPWRMVQWVLEACARPEVRFSILRLVATDDPGHPYEHRLPTDTGVGALPPRLTLRLERGAPGAPLVRHQEGPTLQTAVEKQTGQAPPARVEVPAPGLVTFREMLDALKALRRTGYGDIHFSIPP